MNNYRIIQKWWLLLLQGFFLMILSYAHFNTINTEFSSITINTGFLALLTGSSSVIAYFLSGSEDKNQWELRFGIVNCLLGVLLVSRGALNLDLFHILLSVFMLTNVLQLVVISYHLKTEIRWWWLSVFCLTYTFLLVFYALSGLLNMKMMLSEIIGFQFFSNGLLLFLLSFVLRNLQNEYCKTIEQIRNDTNETIKSQLK